MKTKQKSQVYFFPLIIVMDINESLSSVLFQARELECLILECKSTENKVIFLHFAFIKC